MTTDSLPKVAILLAAYNGMQWIEEQVNSILSQRGVDITLFISVDLSTDGTETYVYKLSQMYSNIIMLSYGEKFGSAAANFFRLINHVDTSTFDYISLCDQDDIWLDDKLIRSIGKIESERVSAYSSDVIAFWPNGREEVLKKSYKQCQYDHYFESPGPGCTFVINSSLIALFQKEFSSFNGLSRKLTVNHDWFIYAFIRSKGYDWFIDSKVTMRYRQHGKNEIGINSGFAAYFSRFKLIRNRWYRNQVLIMTDAFAPSLSEKLINRFFIILNFYKLRRRPRDKFLLLILAIFGLY